MICRSSKWFRAATWKEAAFTDCATGILVNSGILNGLTVEEAKKKIIAYLEEKGIGRSQG